MHSFKKIAVVGAGFVGLAASYHLLKRGGSVTLFDGKGIGGGASGIAAGLLHPYGGSNGSLAWRGQEGMKEAKKLLRLVGNEVFQEGGILKIAVTSKQESALRKLAKRFEDVEWWHAGESELFTQPVFIKKGVPLSGVLVQSGVTVHASLYLKHLWKMCGALGAQFEKKHVFLEHLQGFDSIVLAVGGGIRDFSIVKKLKLSFNKGQLLVCQKPKDFNVKKSFIGKGYLALSERKELCFLGSTYERHFTTEEPCVKDATHFIFNQMSQFFPLYSSFQVQDCLSQMRVVNTDEPRPLIKQLSDKLYVITGMGSSGLLYHALFGKELAERLLK